MTQHRSTISGVVSLQCCQYGFYIYEALLRLRLYFERPPWPSEEYTLRSTSSYTFFVTIAPLEQRSKIRQCLARYAFVRAWLWIMLRCQWLIWYKYGHTACAHPSRENKANVFVYVSGLSRWWIACFRQPVGSVNRNRCYPSPTGTGRPSVRHKGESCC